MRHHFIYFFFFFLCQSITLTAQNDWLIKGVVKDSTSVPMVGATVMLMHALDNKLEGFSTTDSKGAFNVRSETNGSFKLQITYIGYGTFVRPIILNNDKKNINFGEIILRPDAINLEGVTVKEAFIPIVIKKDTIEYHADAFKTKPNASVEDLLKKLPGVEVDKDGKIKAQGEEVHQIYVDGKEFFDDDPKIASRNIPADVVNKVQVFDKKSDFTEFTGIDDGKESKAINLKIKEGKNKGTFGNLQGAYGTDDRYLASANINRFDKKMQLSVLGNFNNTNEQVFSLMDYLDFTGGLEDAMSGEGLDVEQLPINILENSGLTDTYSGGLNFNYDFGKRTSLRSNYFYDRSDNNTMVNGRFQNLLGENIFTNTSESDQYNRLTNHRVRIKLQHTLDNTQDIKAQFKLLHSDNEKQNISESQSFFDGTSLTNESFSDNESNYQNINWSSDLTYRKKFKKKGRFFTTELGLDSKGNDGKGLINNELFFHTGLPIPQKDTIRQKQQSNSENLIYDVTMNYVEPLGEAKYLNFSVSRANNLATSKKLFQDEIRPNTFVINEAFSNNFERAFTQQQAGLAFKWIKTNYIFSVGGEFQNIQLDSENLNNNSQLNKSFNNILPNAGFEYQISSTKQFRFNYSTRINVPSIVQLQPVIDNTNPLNIYSGNPDLSAEYVHRINLNFNSLNQFYFRSLFVGINAQFSKNPIIDSTSINDQLISVRSPINSRGEWQIGGYYDYSSPIRGVNLKLGYSGNFQMQKVNVLINSILDRALFTAWRQTLKIENKKKAKVDWLGGVRVKSNFTNYNLKENEDQTFFDYSFFVDFIWPITDSWAFETNLEHQRYSKTDFADVADFNFVNVTLTKSFFDGKFSVYVKGVNLMNENLSVQRNSMGNQFSEMIKNRLGRYLLVGAVYKIRSFGK